MKKTMFSLIAGLLISCASALTAQAQLARTFVSITGNDANTCDRDFPCRNFNEAISKTAMGGVVTALDSGSYGHITVKKSLTIQGAPGAAVIVSRTAVKGPVVFVELNNYLTVVLRNLHITKPVGNGPNKGIDFRTAGSLHVENCVISGFDFEATDAGISINYPASEADGARLFVKDTLIRGNALGLHLVRNVIASIENCRIENNGSTGISVRNTRTTISNSLVAGNSLGIEISEGGLAYLETCTITNNSMGIGLEGPESPGQAWVFVSNTGIFGNQIALGGSGTSVSFGNNRVSSNISFTYTYMLQ